MIADALRAEIEHYAVWMRRSNPLFRKAEDGTMTAACIAKYLVNVQYLIAHTPVYLVRARNRALTLGDRRLAEHYEHKLGEETGHHVWAERDFECVSMLAGTMGDRELAPAMCDLVAYLAPTIDADPALYLAYILFAEYLIVLLGPEWLRLLEERCGIPRSSMSVIGNHADLDREHVEEALECIDDLVGDARKLTRMRQVVRQSLDYFDRFCAEVTDTVGKYDAWTPARSAEHVPAA